MSAPILATKIAIPSPQPRLVHRHRLTERINASLTQRLTLISAPAGFGKTTLLSDWAAAADRSIAWLALDAAESDLRRFLIYFVSALQTVDPALGAGTLELLQPPETPPAEWVMSDLLNDVAQLGQAFTLILDDYHLIDSRSVDAALTFLLDHLPPTMHLVITTREDPQLPLARYRSRGQLAELREADLRFTPGEAAEFLHQVMGLNLAEHDVVALGARTEGWIAGLQLAALSMQGLPDTAGFIQSFTGTHRFVLDYLLEEVLYRQPEGIQDFLLATSILERLCGALCDAVLGSGNAELRMGNGELGIEDDARSSSRTLPQSQLILERLEHANLFIVPLDHTRRWFRYHQLFAELLQDHLMRTRPDQLPALHRRASDWFAQHDSPAEAVTHALAARDWLRAADVVEHYADTLPMRAGVTTTLGWLESFPAHIRRERPALGLAYAWNLFMDNQLERAEQFLSQLAPLVQAAPHYLGEVFAIRVMIAVHRRDLPAIEALAEDALSHVTQEAAVPRSRMLISLGVALSEIGGDLAGAQRTFREAYALAQASALPSSVGNAPLPLMALAYLAEIEWLRGNLREAARMFGEARQLAARWNGQASIALSLVQQGLASLFYEWGDLDGAADALQESIRIGEAWRNVRLLVPALGLAAGVAQARGQIEQARAAMQRAERLAREAPHSPLIQASLAVHQLALSQTARDWQVAERWQSYFDTTGAAHPGRARGALAIALAKAWIAHKHDRHSDSALQQAHAVIEAALAHAQRDGLQLYVTQLRILEALTLHELGAADAALASLAQALALAGPERYLRSFVELGQPMEALLRRGLASKRLSEPAAQYVRQLLPQFRPGHPARPSPPTANLPIDPLTARELDVLRLIAEGLSNREIGARLFLALSTVKGHTRIIFDKLQVRRRTEAVALARTLGLL